MLNSFYQITGTTYLKTEMFVSDTLKLIDNSTTTLNDKFLGLSQDNAKILIPVIVTLSIFILGIIVNTIIKKYERKSFLYSIKSVLITWIKLLEIPIKQQSESCREFNKRLQESNEMQPERFHFNNMLANKILSIQIKDQIDTVIINHQGKNEDKSKCLFNIISQIEFIDKIEMELRKKYDLYQGDSLKYMNEWNEAIQKLDNVASMFRVKYFTNSSHPVRPFYLEYLRISNLFIHNNPQGANMQVYIDQFLVLISKLCKSFISKNSDEQDVYTLALVIQDLFVSIKKWNVTKSGTGELFMGIADSIDSSLETLLTNIRKLEKMKFKWVLFIR